MCLNQCNIFLQSSDIVYERSRNNSEIYRTIPEGTDKNDTSNSNENSSILTNIFMTKILSSTPFSKQKFQSYNHDSNTMSHFKKKSEKLEANFSKNASSGQRNIDYVIGAEQLVCVIFCFLKHCWKKDWLRD